METYSHRPSVSNTNNVLDLPMRDGNVALYTLIFLVSPVLDLPMRDGNTNGPVVFWGPMVFWIFL